MTYQHDVDEKISLLNSMWANANEEIGKVVKLSHNTVILRSPLYPDDPDDFISGFEGNINNQWWNYPRAGKFIVDTDQDTLITTDAVLQSYGILVQLSYTIFGLGYSWSPGPDDGMFLDRRFGGVNIESIGRKQCVHFLKIPRGEYTLQVRYRLIPDIMYVGLAGVANVSIGIRGL